MICDVFSSGHILLQGQARIANWSHRSECLVSTEEADVLTVLTCPSVVPSVMSVMSVYCVHLCVGTV